MEESRVKNASRNFLSSALGNIINLILSFICRTIFIRFLGTGPLGVNSLFTNILGMLSFAELGIGSAISFSLYKPIAEKNEEKISAIINFYKYAYRIVACVVVTAGIILIPFLKYIVKGVDSVNINLIYLIFLFNTVSSYFITYKTTLISANQKEYILTNTESIRKMMTNIIQIGVIIKFKSFVLYVVTDSISLLISKIYLNIKTERMYPFLKQYKNEKIDDKTKKGILNKIKALIYHKVGEVSIYQTDNIITSAFINTNIVGLVSNFTMIIDYVNKFMLSFFNSAVAGLGNIIATEKKEKQLEISKAYDLLGFIFYGWSTLCLCFLLKPFITLWIGSDKLIDDATILLLCISYYLTGIRVPLGNVKAAAGIYEQDKWVPIIQSVTNIVISIIGVKILGLKGVYIGTIISGLVPCLIRPVIVYKYVFSTSPVQYFEEFFKRLILMNFLILILTLGFSKTAINNLILCMMVYFIIITIVFGILIIFFYKNTNEYKYLKEKFIITIKKVKNKWKKN